MNLLYDVLGWVGAFALLSAYALVSRGRVAGDAATFQVLNLVGAVGLLVNGVFHHAWPSAALNAVWLLVGVGAVGALRRASRAASRPADNDRTGAGQRSR
jgi:hypothetical protein